MTDKHFPHLWIPKRDRIIEVAPRDGLLVPTSRVAGRYKLVAVKADGSGRTRVLADWFDNLITDYGLDNIGYGAQTQYFHVGTDNRAPLVTDTALYGHVASKGPASATSQTAQGSPPYYGSIIRYVRYNPGEAVGNLAEIGLGPSTTNTNLFSRSLIRDSGGNPTTITILVDEYLDVYWEGRIYPGFVDAAGNPVDGSQLGVTIPGVGTVDVTMRCALVTNWQYWTYLGMQPSTTALAPSTYSGPLGAVTGLPSGGNSGNASIQGLSYVGGSYEREFTLNWSLNNGNGTVQCFMTALNYGAYQFQFSPSFTKLNTQTLAINMKLSWARHP